MLLMMGRATASMASIASIQSSCQSRLTRDGSVFSDLPAGSRCRCCPWAHAYFAIRSIVVRCTPNEHPTDCPAQRSRAERGPSASGEPQHRPKALARLAISHCGRNWHMHCFQVGQSTMTAVRRIIEADASLKSGADLNELFRSSAVVVMPSRIQPAPTFNPPPAHAAPVEGSDPRPQAAHNRH